MFDLHFHTVASRLSGLEITHWFPCPVMQPGAGGGGNPALGGRTKLRGRSAEDRPERAGERLMALVASVKSNMRNRRRAELESARGPLQAQPADVLLHRFPHHALEDAVEMVRRETSQPGQLLQAKRIIQMLLDVQQHSS